jgi:hypothetical protein
VASGVCGAQQAQQFQAQPDVEPAGGRVTSILTGIFQYPSGGVDVLYINAPTVANGVSTVTVGALLNGSGSFGNPGNDIIPFKGASNVVAVLGDFNRDGYTDFAFAISGVSTDNLCVYYGTDVQYALTNQNGISSYEGGNTYLPKGSKSGCMTLPNQTTNPSLTKPIFSYIAALTFTINGLPQLLVEDSANNLLYIISNTGLPGAGLPAFNVIQHLSIPTLDGPGPIYTGSFDKLTGNFDNNGHPFFIINGQTGHSATLYTGDSNSVFTAHPSLTFTNGVYSMLLQDMDLDGKPDMVVEGKDGAIEIYQGNGDGTFVATSEGGTAPNLNALSGNGGHLAAIGKLGNDKYNDILTTTPIGLSVLQPQSAGSLTFTLKNIYNIGPGRSSYALASFYSYPSYLDLAVDSPEGVAIIQGNVDSNKNSVFTTNLAYSALAPALGATVGQFRNLAHNSNLSQDVVVATGTGTDAIQAQLLTNNGDGTFTTYAKPTNTTGPPSVIASNLWPNILSGDFNGDGVADLAYSLTGLPLPTTGSGLFVQYGKGDGTFAAPVAVNAASRAAIISTARARWASSTRAATPASPISTRVTTTRCFGRTLTRSAWG